MIEAILGRSLAVEDLIIVVYPAIALLLVIGAYIASDSRGDTKRRRMDRVMGKKTATAGLPVDKQISVRKKTSHSDSAIFDAVIRRLLPKPDLLREKLEAAGLKISVGKYIMVCLGLATIVTTGTLFVPRIPAIAGVLVGLIFGIGFPYIIIIFLKKRRMNKFVSLFPEAIDLMTRGLKSGLPITESIKVSAEEIADPVGTEMQQIIDQIRVGGNMEDALQETSQRLGLQEFQFLTVAMSIQAETGGNLAETLENLSDVLRKRRQLKLKIKALSSEAKASAYIIGSLPFVMVILIHLTNDQYLIPLITDIRGNIMIAAGFLSFLTGAGVMYKMVKFEI